MAIRINPKLIDELEVYGAEDVSKCYHCGNCSAVCVHSEDPYVFPRRSMRNLQMGLEDKLKGGLEPWLCYYCGECSEQCPREAEPGETMMSLRRWLTSRYDWTGISRLFYRSWRWEIGAVLLVGFLTALGFLLFGFSQGSIQHYNGSNAFLPSSKIHIFDWTLAMLLLAVLISNAARMWWFTVGRDRSVKVPLKNYVTRAYLLPAHFMTQMRYAQCARKRPWLTHLVLMLSYLTMLVLIMFFLSKMASGPKVDWSVHVFGYLATVGLVVGSVLFLRNRLHKSSAQYVHSHESDWLFLVLLLVVALTGVAQSILHHSGVDVAANIMYVVHLAVVVPMLALEVPFGKWSHLAYRPLAMYFADVRAEELARREPASVPSDGLQAA
jgi:quinone-modifying oxidoreductase, subunit QmoC